MPDEYVQEHLRATLWDKGPVKRLVSGINDVALCINDHQVTLVTANGKEFACSDVADVADIADIAAAKLIAGLRNTMAGTVLDFGDHRWMVNFGPLLWRTQPKSMLRRVLRAFDPTSRIRDIKKCQAVRDEFLETLRRLGGRVNEPST